MIYTFVATGFLSGDPALTVLAFAEEPLVAPAAPSTMTPPSTGNAGLKGDAGSGATSLLAVGAVLTLVTMERLSAGLPSAASSPVE